MRVIKCDSCQLAIPPHAKYYQIKTLLVDDHLVIGEKKLDICVKCSTKKTIGENTNPPLSIWPYDIRTNPWPVEDPHNE